MTEKKSNYNFSEIEKKWQKKWEEKKVFVSKENPKKRKFYVLEMYPYPSGSGLHMGHAFNYTIGDIFARFMRMQGYNVLHPMGYDSFGLPAENAAIKEKSHPKKFTDSAIKNYIKQQKKLGLSYDWNRMLMSHDSEYYKWNQWIFLKMFEQGLAYRKRAYVNWCPKCQTVLANEQVHQGKCWRHEDTNVETKSLEQWFIKTTEYIEEILEMTDDLNWPERIKIMQKNWIGKSEGAEINFEINGEQWNVFTTRPDTLFGVTFLVVSSQHERLMELVTSDRKKSVEVFMKKIKSVSQRDKLEKEGVFTGSYAIHPLTKKKIPVYTGTFVVAEYGSGMVMGVPAHDQRDFEFAEKYGIEIKVVVEPKDYDIYERNGQIPRAYTEEGFLVNSMEFNEMESEKARKGIVKYLEGKKIGKKSVHYKMRDWLVSRQRYWGTPIPIIYCDSCGIVPVPENQLPVLLPEKVKFGKGNPLKTNKKFLEVKCPKCGGKGTRETDTMDTFFDSSWYYLRYTDNKNTKKPFDFKKADYWMPVDFYTGGAEHACMHLIYARFFTKFLRDIKMVKIDEPFKRLFNQGMVHGKDGYVMSKSRENVIDPMTTSDKYGVDVLRLFLVSMGSPDNDFRWSDKEIEGSFKFIKKVSDYFIKTKFKNEKKEISTARKEHIINKSVKGITSDIESLKYNAAIIKLRDFFDSLEHSYDKKVAEIFLKLLSPFCPHITEEFWHKLGNKGFISLEPWPIADEKKINPRFEQEDKTIKSVINDVNNIVNIVKSKNQKIKTAYLYVMPQEISMYNDQRDYISQKIGLNLKIFPVNDKNKYDPEKKSRKAKPGKPGIYLE